MNLAYTKLLQCFESIKERIPFKPKVALILGSGLGDYGDTMDIVATIPYKDIAGFPQSTVQGHETIIQEKMVVVRTDNLRPIAFSKT